MPGLFRTLPLNRHLPGCPCYSHEQRRHEARRATRKAARIAADTARARAAKGWKPADFAPAA